MGRKWIDIMKTIRLLFLLVDHVNEVRLPSLCLINETNKLLTHICIATYSLFLSLINLCPVVMVRRDSTSSFDHLYIRNAGNTEFMAFWYQSSLGSKSAISSAESNNRNDRH
jgi:hypothetical protein